MLTGKFFLTIIIITVAVSCIQWLVIGVIMHKYQAVTPDVWRKESSSSYMASMAADLLFAFFFTLIFSLVIRWQGKISITDALKFAVLLWLAFSVAAEINNVIYIKYDTRFFVGKIFSSLLEFIVSAIIAALIL